MEKRQFLYRLGKGLLFLVPFGEMEDILRDYAGFPQGETEQTPEAVAKEIPTKGNRAAMVALRCALVVAVLVLGAVAPFWLRRHYFYQPWLPYALSLLLGLAFPWLLLAATGGKKQLLLWKLRPRHQTPWLDEGIALVLHGTFAAGFAFLGVSLWRMRLNSELWLEEKFDSFHLLFPVVRWVIPLGLCVLLLGLVALARRRSTVYLLPLCHGYLLLLGVCRLLSAAQEYAPDLATGQTFLQQIICYHLLELASFAVLLAVLWVWARKIPPLLPEKAEAVRSKQTYLWELAARLLCVVPFREMQDILKDYAGFPVEELCDSPRQVVAALGKKPWARWWRLAAMAAGVVGFAGFIYAYTHPLSYGFFYGLLANRYLFYGLVFAMPLLLFAVLGGRKLLLLQGVQNAVMSRREKGLLWGGFALLSVPFPVTHLIFLQGQYGISQILLGWQEATLTCLALCIPLFLYLMLARTAAYFFPLAASYLLFFAGLEYKRALYTISDIAFLNPMGLQVLLIYLVGLAELLALFLLLRRRGGPLPLDPPPAPDGEELRQKKFLHTLAEGLLFRVSFGEMRQLLREYTHLVGKDLTLQPRQVIDGLGKRSRGRTARVLLAVAVLALAVSLAFWVGSSAVATDLKRLYFLVAVLLAPGLLFGAMGGRKLLLLRSTQFAPMQSVEIGVLAAVHIALYLPFVFCLWDTWSLRALLDPRHTYVPMEGRALVCLLVLLPVFAWLACRRNTVYFLLMGNCYLLILLALQILSMQRTFGVGAYPFAPLSLQCFSYYLAGLGELLLLWQAAKERVGGV